MVLPLMVTLRSVQILKLVVSVNPLETKLGIPGTGVVPSTAVTGPAVNRYPYAVTPSIVDDPTLTGPAQPSGVPDQVRAAALGEPIHTVRLAALMASDETVGVIVIAGPFACQPTVLRQSLGLVVTGTKTLPPIV